MKACFALQNSTICPFEGLHFFVPFNFEGVAQISVLQLLANLQNNPT